MIAFSITIDVGSRSIQGLLLNAPDHDHHPSEWLADYVYREHPSDKSVASFVIVRPPVERTMTSEEFKASLFPALQQRLPSLPIYLLSSADFVHTLSENFNLLSNDPLLDVDRKTLLDSIRQQELAMYALSSNALLRMTGNRYFRAPSLKYCQCFMRVGNIQTSRSAVDAVFYWLLPWLKDCSAIIAESWTVSSAVLNAARLLVRYDPDNHPRCRVDMLSAYHDRSAPLQFEAEEILRRVLPRETDKVLILVSSCMSGGLVNKLKETFRAADVHDTQWECATLFSLGSSHQVPALCDATQFVSDDGFKFYEELPENGRVFEIDRGTYFPLRIEVLPVELKKVDADQSKYFFDAYKNTKLFCVHRECYEQRGGRLRHHAIDLEVSAILELEPFATRFAESIKGISPPPTVIVVPPHDAGVAMSEIAKRLIEASGSSVEILVHKDLIFSATDERKNIFNNLASLLILDDVSVTGSRMSNFAQSLRTLGFSGELHFRVGIARPTSAKHWRKVCSRLKNNGISSKCTIEAIHEVVLPDWDSDECPWCIERQLYADALSQVGASSDFLTDRLRQLHSDEFTEPWTDDIFCASTNAPFSPMAPGSIFVDSGATYAAMFAAISSLLQRMRVGEASSMLPTAKYPEVTTLLCDEYLGVVSFPEASIRAAIMRATLASELDTQLHASEMARAESARASIVSGGHSLPLTIEILLQSKLGRLPRLKLNESEISGLEQLHGPIVRFLI